MFKRKLEDELVKWKKSSIRKPLIIKGARQVGKTSLIRNFARKNFNDLFEINLEKRESLELFRKSVSVFDFIQKAQVYLEKKFVPAKTLLFIDEIQESPEVLALLRFFAEERPDIFVVTTGSLLQAKLNKDFNIPVGRVEYRYLYPLTFFEYLEATGKTNLLTEIKNLKLNQNYVWDKLAEDEFKKYLFIGGMPEVISTYLEDKDLLKVREVLARLQTTFVDDIAKYMKSLSEKKFMELVIEEGPRFAGLLFKYEGFAGSVFRSREMSSAFSSVEKAMLLNQLLSINSTTLPIFYKYKRPKKLIWLDVGIVNYVNNSYPEMIKGVYKGRIMEQVVGQTLEAQLAGTPVKLGYWAKDKTKGSAEVDFCFQYESKIVGLEVKSGSNKKSRSLSSMVQQGKGKVIPVQVSWEKLEKKKNGVINIPFYLLEKWEEILSQV